MSMTNEPAVELTPEPTGGLDAVGASYDSEAENWLTRGIGTFLGLAVSAAAVGGVIGLLHMHGH